MPDNFRTCWRRLGHGRSAGNFRFTDKGCSFLDDETRGFQISLQCALRFQFAALGHRDIALYLAVHRDRLGFYLAPNVRVLADRQDAVRIDFAFDLAIDEKFFLKLDRAFDFDIARENVFATMFCHMFLVIDYC